MNKLTIARNHEFANRCIEIFRADFNAGRVAPLDSIIERALAMSPRSHYITYDAASRRLHSIMRHGIEAVVKEESARQMWQEIYDQVQQTMQRRRKPKFHAALTFVLNFMRPSRFYITYDTARRILAPYISYSLTLNRC